MIDKIQLAHGSGGRMTRELIEDLIINGLGESALSNMDDAAVMCLSGKIAFTTDSFVVSPIEFPGGDIGKLCVHGTVNDLAVQGAVPKYLSLAFILEEGLDVATLKRIVDSISMAAKECDVLIVAGDTKVVPKGHGDGIYINTTGIGLVCPEMELEVSKIVVGDVLLVNGTIGDHGMAIMAERNNIPVEPAPISDTASVYPFVEQLNKYGSHIKFMRDITRGGLATVLNEIVENGKFGIELDEEKIPRSKVTQSVADLLGIDILHSACEGRMLCICDKAIAQDILNLWRSFDGGTKSAIIGKVTDEMVGNVWIETCVGGSRIIDVPYGEILPRIC
jgi:hydrogenase expression/formation protein HypE